MGTRFFPPVGGATSVSVASSNTSDTERLDAKHICDGSADEIKHNASITDIGSLGGIIQFTAGTFYCSDSIHPANKPTIFQGKGRATVFEWTAGSGFTKLFAPEGSANYQQFRDFTIKNLYTGTAYEPAGIMTMWGTPAYEWYDWVVDNVECDRCQIVLRYITSGRCMVKHCYVHDINGAAAGISFQYCSKGMIANNIVANSWQMGIGAQFSHYIQVHDNYVTMCGTGTPTVQAAAFGIDVHCATYSTIHNNIVYSKQCILSEDSAGDINITNNICKGTAVASGAGIKVWQNGSIGTQACRYIVTDNDITQASVGIYIIDAGDGLVSGNRIYNINGNGIQVSKSSWGTDPRVIQITDNDIYEYNVAENWNSGIYIAGTINSAQISRNNVDSGNNASSYGIRVIGTGLSSSSITNNKITSSAGRVYATGAYVKDNLGYISPNDIRIMYGSLTPGTANAFAFAWQNPEAQDIIIDEVSIWVTTAAGGSGAVISCGTASGSTSASSNIIAYGDINTTGFLSSTSKFKLEEKDGTTDWITGQILLGDASSLAGSYYVRYMGV